MCKRYKLQAKRPHQKEFTDWCSTYDYEVIKRNIKVIESYGYQWKLRVIEREEGLKVEQKQRDYSPRVVSETMRLLGERIKNAREAKGVNQKEMAKKMRVSNSMLCLVENGKRNISEELLYDVADALDMRIDELVGRSRR